MFAMKDLGQYEAFVSDINRARVLRVRSIMKPLQEARSGEARVDCDATLEQMIALAQGEIGQGFVVTEAGKPVGWFDMPDLMKTQVPRRRERSVK